MVNKPDAPSMVAYMNGLDLWFSCQVNIPVRPMGRIWVRVFWGALFASCLRTKTWRLDLERLYDDFPEGSTPETSLKADSFVVENVMRIQGYHPQCQRFPKK